MIEWREIRIIFERTTPVGGKLDLGEPSVVLVVTVLIPSTLVTHASSDLLHPSKPNVYKLSFSFLSAPSALGSVHYTLLHLLGQLRTLEEQVQVLDKLSAFVFVAAHVNNATLFVYCDDSGNTAPEDGISVVVDPHFITLLHLIAPSSCA
ncbi:hypothetical protein QE327_gp143 [Pseudomonas phage Henu5]|uniref:Uncharacterized protein n=1 Tax=Pseudomonas phage Henu5 TaxID=2499902 RepID=A0A410T8A3_9CAUD|nr:hypothetical protein QE327_gp143 [Pseudomonas phage Henu5]QAU05176.1 hypothetical protein Henu5_gp150 [Pseudomonas phage Henu5]